MNVLAVVQNFLVGGLETRIQGEIRWANDHGHGTYLATSGGIVAENLPGTTLGITTGLDISDSASASGLMNTVDCLVDIVIDNNIDVIHAHPFAALLPAMLASQLTKTPLVVSLHGPASLSPAQKIGQWRMQLAFALTHASLIACVSPEVEKLAKRLSCHDRIEVFPNCVNIQEFNQSPKNRSKGNWALIGRLDRDKKEGVIEFLNASRCLSVQTLDIIGDGECRGDLEEYVKTSKRRFPNVRFLGARQQIVSEMRNYDAVAGMGRVVLEAVAMSIPVVLAGYDGVKGWVDEDLFVRAAYGNFSGRGIENSTEYELRKGLSAICDHGVENLRRLLVSKYDEDVLWKGFYSKIDCLSFDRCVLTNEIIEIFRRFSGTSVPYCEHPDVVKEIECLLHSKEQECFSESSAAVDWYDVLKTVKGWRDGEMAECVQWYESQIKWRDNEIYRVKGSMSWRMTRPVRFLESAVNKVRSIIF